MDRGAWRAIVHRVTELDRNFLDPGIEPMSPVSCIAGRSTILNKKIFLKSFPREITDNSLKLNYLVNF